MKSKRYTTEDKIRILREADAGKSILEVCREHNISEVSFHRWKQQFGQLEVTEARRLKELERENGELKKMLAEALLKNRVLEAVCEKNSKPGASTGSGADDGGGGGMLRAGGLPHPAVIALYLLVSGASTHDGPTATAAAVAGVVGRTSALRVSADRGAVGRGRLAGGQATDSTTPACGRTARSPESAKAYSTRGFDRSANQSHAPRARLDLGLHCRCHRARRRLTDVNDPG
jgi:putative transposase